MCEEKTGYFVPFSISAVSSRFEMGCFVPLPFLANRLISSRDQEIDVQSHVESRMQTVENFVKLLRVLIRRI